MGVCITPIVKVYYVLSTMAQIKWWHLSLIDFNYPLFVQTQKTTEKSIDKQNFLSWPFLIFCLFGSVSFDITCYFSGFLNWYSCFYRIVLVFSFCESEKKKKNQWKFILRTLCSDILLLINSNGYYYFSIIIWYIANASEYKQCSYSICFGNCTTDDYLFVNYLISISNRFYDQSCERSHSNIVSNNRCW